MTRQSGKYSGTIGAVIRFGLGVGALGLWLSTPFASAGMVSIAATPGVVSEVEAIAMAFEAANPGDRVQIAITSEAELKENAKGLPVQFIVSDNVSLIDWLEARKLAMRTRASPTVHAHLAVVASASSSDEFNTSRDLINRLKHRGITITIPDPGKTDSGPRAQALLNTLGVSLDSSERIVLAPNEAKVIELVKTGKAHYRIMFESEAMNEKGMTIHAQSGLNAFSSMHIFAVKSGHQDHPVGMRFLAFVNSQEGQHALKVKGYELAQGSPTEDVPLKVLKRESSVPGH
jgi:molybdenum ABC transporter molybdate-binding protein